MCVLKEVETDLKEGQGLQLYVLNTCETWHVGTAMLRRDEWMLRIHGKDADSIIELIGAVEAHELQRERFESIDHLKITFRGLLNEKKFLELAENVENVET